MINKIIIDTDIGGDCDDAAALAVALELMNAGECQIIAVTHCTMYEEGAGCIEAILNYYGHPEIPIGCFNKEDNIKGEWCNIYATDVALRYPTRYMTGAHYENSVRVMRKTLAEAEEKVTIVTIGFFTTIARLLQSDPDEYSDLTGFELVKNKVERVICMGGMFKEFLPGEVLSSGEYTLTPECNVKADILSSKIVFEKWPTELVLCSFEIGVKIITCGDLQINGNIDNPVRKCYETWSEKFGNGAIGRESWDPVTLLYSIRPESQYYDLYPYGRICVDDQGCTTWHPDDDCRHTFLKEKKHPKEIEREINKILNRDITRIHS